MLDDLSIDAIVDAYTSEDYSGPTRAEMAMFAFEHIDDFGCCCPGCLLAQTGVDAAGQTDLPTTYSEAIDWGGPDNKVDSGEFNADGDMVIEYYFEPGQGNFQFFFPRLEWTDYEKQQVEVALSTFETFINVEFVETDNVNDAEFRLNKIDSRDQFLGVMNPPGTGGAGKAGFAAQDGAAGWDSGDADGNPTNGGLEQGGFGFITLVHEFGHGLGLAHPHDTGGGSSVLPGVTGDPQVDTGDFELNQGVYTMMSYVDGWATHPDGALGRDVVIDYGYIGGPMALDIAVLQEKYGANMDHATGDDVYILPDANEAGTYFTAIWDAGGTDELRYDGDSAASIDLRAATLELEPGGGGWISFADGVFGGYTIANGVVIENATGGNGNDAIVANAFDNRLTGNGGADTFIFTDDGGASIDTITDFEVGTDVVDLTDLGRVRKRNVDVEESGGDTIVTVFDQTIVFEDVARGDLSFSDFLLA